MKKKNIPLGFEEIEKNLSNFPDWPDEEVPEGLDVRFNYFLNTKVQKPNYLWTALKYAAGISVVLGAFWIGKNQQPLLIATKKETMVTRPIKTIIRDTVYIKSPKFTSTEGRVIRKMQGPDVGNTKKELFGFLKESSASLRLKGINELGQNADQEVLDVLIFMLDNDPNENVRMAAAENIGRFGNIPKARTAMVESLMKQNDNAVQYAVLHTLTQWKEKQAIPAIRLLRNYDNIDTEYKNILDQSIEYIITSK